MGAEKAWRSMIRRAGNERRKSGAECFCGGAKKARVGKGGRESGFHFVHTKFPEKFTKRGAGASLAA